jgi:hypothetical protein
MEFVRPIITDTQHLDLPSSSRQHLYSGRFINHPFMAGFSQSINSIIRGATDVISVMKSGMSVPADILSQSFRFGDSPKSPDQSIDNARNTASLETPAPNIAQPSIEHGRTSSEVQQTAPERKREKDIKQQLANRKDAQTLNNQQPTASTNSSSQSKGQQQHPNEASGIAESSTTGLKFSHSRLEGTDLAIDAALIASGMGGVLVMEHLIDMALHTKMKKENINPHLFTGYPRNVTPMKGESLKSTADPAVKNNPTLSPEPGTIHARNGVDQSPTQSVSRLKR